MFPLHMPSKQRSRVVWKTTTALTASLAGTQTPSVCAVCYLSSDGPWNLYAMIYAALRALELVRDDLCRRCPRGLRSRFWCIGYPILSVRCFFTSTWNILFRSIISHGIGSAILLLRIFNCHRSLFSVSWMGNSLGGQVGGLARRRLNLTGTSTCLLYTSPSPRD